MFQDVVIIIPAFKFFGPTNKDQAQEYLLSNSVNTFRSHYWMVLQTSTCQTMLRFVNTGTNRQDLKFSSVVFFLKVSRQGAQKEEHKLSCVPEQHKELEGKGHCCLNAGLSAFTRTVLKLILCKGWKGR